MLADRRVKKEDHYIFSSKLLPNAVFCIQIWNKAIHINLESVLSWYQSLYHLYYIASRYRVVSD